MMYRFTLLALTVGLLSLSLSAQPGSAVPKTEPGLLISNLAFSPDGKYLAARTAGTKKLLCLWETATRKPVLTQNRPDGVRDIAFSPDGTLLAVVVPDQPVQLLDVPAGAVRRALRGKETMPRRVAFAPDGKTLAVAGDTAITLWDPTTGKEAQTIPDETQFRSSVAFSPDGKRLASSTREGIIRLWDLATGKVKQTLSEDSAQIAFAGDDRWLLAGTGHGFISLWDTENGEHRFSLGRTGGVQSMVYSLKAGIVASCGAGGREVTLFELTFQEPTPPELQRIRAIIQKWEDDSYEIREEATREIKQIGMIAETELRKTAKEGPSVEVRMRARLALEEGLYQPRAMLVGHTEQVRSVAFSPDGKLLASGSEDGVVILWDVANRKELARLAP
jgi:WD40 repeat protein